MHSSFCVFLLEPERMLYLFIFLLVLANNCYATDYYFANAPTGSNANNGLSANSPWETLSKLPDPLPSGSHQILLRRGDIFRESITIKKSGVVCFLSFLLRFILS